MVDRIRWDTVSYLPFYYVFFQFLLLTIFNLQANILTTKDILSNLGHSYGRTALEFGELESILEKSDAFGIARHFEYPDAF